MIIINIYKELYILRDEEYKKFNGNLVKGTELIGVRIPDIRKLANRIIKEDSKAYEAFINNLPHKYLEENHLHAFLLMEEKDNDKLIKETEKFLPFIDNWQTCDSFLPDFFKKDENKVPELINNWLNSEYEYTKRYGIRLKLARKEFTLSDMKAVIKAGSSDYYYVYMAAAWYLSMAAIENREDFLKVFGYKDMDERLYSKTLRKICESTKLSSEEKEFFKESINSID